jgi:hypothetical protein
MEVLAGARNDARETDLRRLLLRFRWPRPSRLPQHRPVPGVLAGICVVDPGLAVDRVHGHRIRHGARIHHDLSPGPPHHLHSRCHPVTQGPQAPARLPGTARRHTAPGAAITR